MNPLTLMANDINNLKNASAQLFDQWNDSVSDQFKASITDEILKEWTSFNNEINIRMKSYMNAEKELMGSVQTTKKYKF